jgi:DNA mismatch repair ATPase MutS
VPLNIFLAWDLQQVFALERWKKNHKGDADAWFDVLGQMEMLNSLGTLAFNHPHWSFPELQEFDPLFEGKELRHPLIPPQKSVANDFSIRGKGRVAIVTGSNMAGKSTFLRTVGVNMVLACAGAPVCARGLRMTPMQVMSSMRIMDNLEESTSTFYAELKKLGAIIEAVKQKRPVFILLDEMLRGTNSQDRQTGSMALVRQLIREQAIGIVATHDLGLAAMEKEFPGAVTNHHFDVQVSEGEMYFDYTLKSGVCTSMNASLLMRKIGISLDA